MGKAERLSALGLLLLLAACSAAEDRFRPLDQVVNTMRSGYQVESFSLQGPGVVTDTLTPNVAGMAIKSQGPDLQPSEVALLCRLVLEAADQECGEAKRCVFVPQYAFRFHNAGSTLDLLIEVGCPTLGFWSGREALEGVPIYSGNAYCVADSLSMLVEGLFQD